MDPDAAQRLWTLTRGNVLYLRNIVEQEVADGRLDEQHGFWRWIDDPVIAPGLVELIESRIGDLPAPVTDVIDALAVGEPIELAGPDADHRYVRPSRRRTPAASSRSSPSSAVWKCGWRIRFTARCEEGARRPPGCGGCGDWLPTNSPHPTTVTTPRSRCDVRH